MIQNFTVFEIIKRIAFLVKAKEDIIEYLNNLGHGHLHPSETNASLQKRQKINFKLTRLTLYVSESGAPISFLYSPPPAIGGVAGRIEMFSNFFNLYTYQISPQIALDSIDQAIGNYENEKRRALIRTSNPFWWLLKFFRLMIRAPFLLLREAGFNGKKLKHL